MFSCRVPEWDLRHRIESEMLPTSGVVRVCIPFGKLFAKRSVVSAGFVEAYPDDKYLPSFLVPATGAENAFHVLFAALRAE